MTTHTGAATPATPSVRHHTDSTASILEAAHRVLARQPLTIRAVAFEARVAPMTVYQYFRSKHALISAVADDGVELLDCRIRRRIAANPDDLHRFREAACELRQFALGHPRLHSLMVDTRRRDNSAIYAAAGERLIGEIVRRGQLTGTFRADPTITQQTWACLYGAITMNNGLANSRDPRIAAINHERVIALLIDGIRSSSNTSR